MHSQEYKLVDDPGKWNKGVHCIWRMNQEMLNLSISSQESQKAHSHAQFDEWWAKDNLWRAFKYLMKYSCNIQMQNLKHSENEGQEWVNEYKYAYTILIKSAKSGVF